MQVYIPSVHIINRDGVFFQGAYVTSTDFLSPKNHPQDVNYKIVFLRLIRESMHYTPGVYDLNSALGAINQCYADCFDNDYSPEEEQMLVDKTIERYEYFPITYAISLDGYDPDTVSAHSLCLCLDTFTGYFKEISLFNLVFAAERMKRAQLKD